MASSGSTPRDGDDQQENMSPKPQAEDGEQGPVSNWFNGIGSGMGNIGKTVGSIHSSMRESLADLPDVPIPSVLRPNGGVEGQISISSDESARIVSLLEKVRGKYKQRLEAEDSSEIDGVLSLLQSKLSSQDDEASKTQKPTSGAVESPSSRKSWRLPPPPNPNGSRDLPDEWVDEMTSLDFDLRKVVDHVGEENVLSAVCIGIFRARNYLQVLGVEEGVFTTWLDKVASGYHPKNPYHNQIHAADVVITSNGLLFNSIIEDLDSDMESIGLLLAAAAHDYAHPGRTNNFLVATKHDLAIRYNDTAILENFHVSSTFTLMQQPSCNILKGLGSTEYTSMRKLMISLILATDLTQHFTTVSTFKSQVEGGSIDMKKPEDRNLLLKVILKAADVSNPTKPKSIYKFWTNAIMEEFYQQGDDERAQGLKCSPFMDRTEPSLVKCQMGFMDFIVAPLFKQLSDFVSAKYSPRKSLRETMDNLAANKAIWSKVNQEHADAAMLQFCPNSYFPAET